MDISDSITVSFRQHVARWKAERGPRSTAKSMTKQADYQAIIDLGEPAIPLILDELERETDHWFVALRAITGENPVRPEDQGDLKKMAESWIDWGHRNGYEWQSGLHRMVSETRSEPIS